jgi:hypothetical protein
VFPLFVFVDVLDEGNGVGGNGGEGGGQHGVGVLDATPLMVTRNMLLVMKLSVMQYMDTVENGFQKKVGQK